jgi:hypothetical protein
MTLAIDMQGYTAFYEFLVDAANLALHFDVFLLLVKLLIDVWESKKGHRLL